MPPDGIPAIIDPEFVSIAEARGLLSPEAPVIVVEVDGDARAYPTSILLRHEIVDDVVGATPLAITFCPLCNTAIVFDRRVGDRVLTFKVSGNLRNSDLVMYDVETESWWQQITGEAIVGEFAGTSLPFVSSQLISLAEFEVSSPAGRVLSPGDESLTNPYLNYDDPGATPFLFGGTPDPRLPAMTYVATVRINDDAVAIPFTLLAERRVVTESIGGEDVVFIYAAGLRSVLDTRDPAEGRDVGQIGVFSPVLADGTRLELVPDGKRGFVDQATHSRWTIAGVAMSGPLSGTRLRSATHGEHFWFAWAAFYPETRVVVG